MLNTESAWTCSTNESFTLEVASSNGKDTYTVRWGRLPEDSPTIFGPSCTCKGFTYRQTCKHLLLMEQRRCGWNACLEPTYECDRDENNEPCCPDCGGPVTAHRVGV